MPILLELFEENISKFLSSLGLATREDVEIIEDRLGRLEERLADIKALYQRQDSPERRTAAKGPSRRAPSAKVKKTTAVKKTGKGKK